MNKKKKLWKKIQEYEKELLAASPDKAAKLTPKIVKWKGQVFDE